MDDSLFRPDVGTWRGVSPDLALVRRIVVVVPLVLLCTGLVAGAVLTASLGGPGWVALLLCLAAALGVGLAGWTWWWARRNQRAWAYVEAEDDLLITSGVMFRRLVAVPYGRMQYVDVTAGPIERWRGITRVRLFTASSETAATVPGVPADEARRLRNRLTDLGEARDAGL